MRRERIDLVHARSYLPALVALGTGRPFVFDMRGFWPRERVDGGIWREGSPVHHLATALEKLLLARASAVILLANAARPDLPSLSVPIRVVPTVTDLTRFRPDLPPPPGGEPLRDREVFVLAGALGSWYRLEAALDFLALAVAKRERAHVLVLSEEDRTPALEGLAARGVAPDRVTGAAAPPDAVPNWFSLGAAGILFIESAPSKRASIPTKLGEFLACGVAVLVTPGIGDTEEWLTGTGAGVVVRSLAGPGLESALAEFSGLPGSRKERARRCREVARRHLDLGGALGTLDALYREVLGGDVCA